MNLKEKIKENNKILEKLSKENYEAYIIALLIFETKNCNVNSITDDEISIYESVYTEYLKNDGFNLLNEAFEYYIDENQKKSNQKIERNENYE